MSKPISVLCVCGESDPAETGSFIEMHRRGIDVTVITWPDTRQWNMLMEAGVEGYHPIYEGSHRDAIEALYIPVEAEAFATSFVDARTEAEKAFVSVLAETPPTPFEVAAFGPLFPDELRDQIEGLMRGFSDENHPAYWVWEDSLGSAYWSDGWVMVTGKDFRFLKDAMKATGFEF